jgi:hypothetical protein
VDRAESGTPAMTEVMLSERLARLTPQQRMLLHARAGRGGTPQRHPLSTTQFGMWLFEQLHPGTAAYNNPAAVRLHGTLDVPALVAAFTAVQDRHAPLRSRYVEDDDGEVAAVVSPPGAPFHLERADVRAQPRPAAAAAALARTTCLAPFDLAAGPVWRARLIRSGAADWVLALGLHHIVSDGTSLGIILAELGEVYRAGCQGRPPRLAPLDRTYFDLIRHREHGPGQAAADLAMDYWRTVLAGLPDTVDLSRLGAGHEPADQDASRVDAPAPDASRIDAPAPDSAEPDTFGTDTSRLAAAGPDSAEPDTFGTDISRMVAAGPDAAPEDAGAAAGGAVPVDLGGALTAGFGRACREHGASVFAGTAGMLAVLLHLSSGQRVLPLLTPVDTREAAGARLVGCLVNTVLLRLEIDPAGTLGEVLGHAGRQVAAAVAHHQAPFGRVVAQAAADRADPGRPFGNVAVVHNNAPAGSAEWAGLTLTRQPIPVAAVRYDLALSLGQQAGALRGELEYAARLPEPAVRALAGDLVRLAALAVAEPDLPVAAVTARLTGGSIADGGVDRSGTACGGGTADSGATDAGNTADSGAADAGGGVDHGGGTADGGAADAGHTADGGGAAGGTVDGGVDRGGGAADAGHTADGGGAAGGAGGGTAGRGAAGAGGPRAGR